MLERFAENTDKAVEIAIQNSSTFLHDPVNIIQSINRFTNGWMKLHEQVYVDNNLGRFKQQSIDQYHTAWFIDYLYVIIMIRYSV